MWKAGHQIKKAICVTGFFYAAHAGQRQMGGNLCVQPRGFTPPGDKS
jgi:hypothetical protein